MRFIVFNPYIVMKTLYLKLTIVLVVSVLLGSCADRFSSGYVLELPEVPEPWVSLLGQPGWRIEWFDSGGGKKIMDIPQGSGMEIEIPVTWANPVTASPYWQNYNLNPGLFKPAGAIFPFDANGSRLCLSWEGGADAVFYWELLLAERQGNSNLPGNFDWPRFRALFKEGTLSEEVCENPWLVNWRSVAEKTALNGFDRRRLVSETAVYKTFPVPSGSWYGTSPFSKPLVFEEGELPAFPVSSGINVWISSEGILKVNGDVWVFKEIWSGS